LEESGVVGATLTSMSDQDVRLRLPEAVGKGTFTPAFAASPDKEQGEGYWQISLSKGAPLCIAAGVPL
jgi:hypothetical protein